MKVASNCIVLFTAVAIIITNLLTLTFSQSYPTVNKSKTNEVIGYFRGKNNLEDKFFSSQAKIHLKDVKSLIVGIFCIDVSSILLALALAAYLINNQKFVDLKKAVITGSLITIILVLVALILSFLNFEFFFIKFHEIIFRNNYWLFSPEDNLVKIFPEEFFISSCIAVNFSSAICTICTHIERAVIYCH